MNADTKGESMGTVYRKTATKPLPSGAKLIVRKGERLAEWADTKADPRRKRRALDEGELVRLLGVARRRPLLDAMMVRRGKHKGEAVAVLRDETQQRLDLLGRERALIYKTLILTGLRKGELTSLTVAHLDLDSDPAYLTLDAADEKNREGNTLAVRSDLAADLRLWLADKAAGGLAADSANRPIRPGSRPAGRTQ